MGISKSEFAERQGVSKGRVSQWLKTGVIKCLSDGSIDPEEGEYELSRNRDANKRLDYKLRIEQKRFTHDDSPPPPFTGSLRDFAILGFMAFYPFYIEKMAPLLLDLLKQHVADKNAKGATVCFAFKVRELIDEFVGKDIFKKFLRDKTGEDLDQLSADLFYKGKRRKGCLPRRLHLKHPPIVARLLKEIGSDWPFEG